MKCVLQYLLPLFMSLYIFLHSIAEKGVCEQFCEFSAGMENCLDWQSYRFQTFDNHTDYDIFAQLQRQKSVEALHLMENSCTQPMHTGEDWLKLGQAYMEL